jgi:hypothetical protein
MIFFMGGQKKKTGAALELLRWLLGEWLAVQR